MERRTFLKKSTGGAVFSSLAFSSIRTLAAGEPIKVGVITQEKGPHLSIYLDALAKAYKPLGQWQTYEITCTGETMGVKLNGAQITTATSIKNLKGHIGIQGEHGLLEFRKIDLKPMPQSQQ